MNIPEALAKTFVQWVVKEEPGQLREKNLISIINHSNHQAFEELFIYHHQVKRHLLLSLLFVFLINFILMPLFFSLFATTIE